MDDLTQKIKKLVKEDQTAINSYKSGEISKQEWVDKSDLLSKSFLDLLDEYGFPYHNQYPVRIYTAGITMSLHLNLRDMKRVYKGFIKSANVNMVLNEHKIILIDKILVLSGKPQRYGSQYKISSRGKIRLIPVIDRRNLDKRRLKLGLSPIKEYIDSIKQS